MAYLNTIGCGAGQSSSRPPLFDDTNFATWKMRFHIYARSQGVRVWMAIEDGVIIPTKTVDDIIIEKKVSEYNAIEEERMNIDAKVEMVCLNAKKDLWYLDSGCSRHITGNKSLLNNIKKFTAGSVTFEDRSKGIIIGIGDIGNEHFKIFDVQLATGLKYNLLSISQLCNNGNKEQPLARSRVSEVVKALDHIVSQPYFPKSPPAESTPEIPVISWPDIGFNGHIHFRLFQRCSYTIPAVSLIIKFCIRVMMTGSPVDVSAHYSTSLELSRLTGDYFWQD
ncbi:hypothetical protein AgCh_022909 [Apium graveolens]